MLRKSTTSSKTALTLWGMDPDEDVLWSLAAYSLGSVVCGVRPPWIRQVKAHHTDSQLDQCLEAKSMP